jgi:hypothetical protein
MHISSPLAGAAALVGLCLPFALSSAKTTSAAHPVVLTVYEDYV